MESGSNGKDLLDLPPEIIERILAAYVSKFGVIVAWKSRQVCRAFSTCITHNILAKQPIGAFLKISPNNGRMILKMNLSTYLKYRIKKLNGAHEFLPSFITWVLDRIEKICGVVDSSTRMKNEGYLCNILTAECEAVFHLVTTNKKRQSCQQRMQAFDESRTDFLISAAAAIGDIKALDFLLTLRPNGMWIYSPVFGYPLAVAAYTGQVELVKHIIHGLECTDSANGKEVSESAFMRAIRLSLKKQNNDLTQILASFYAEYLPVVQKDDSQDWLVSAVRSGNHTTIAAIMKLKHFGGAECYVKGLKAACELGDHESIGAFFKGHLNLNQDIGQFGSPLGIAVCSGQLSSVKAMLDMGAYPDGPRQRSGGVFSVPLIRATLNDHLAIVEILFDYGASEKPLQEAIKRRYCSTENTKLLKRLLLKVKACSGGKNTFA